ncbi:MAG: Ig-like domain-containing protein [Coriobacteriales bacterium]|nr:Ig-like domain-containing protein [Coriobacteriales bacterium]
MSGGTVTATSRNANSQDIGNGSTSSTDDNTAASVVIDGGTVWATNGRVAYGSQASTDIKNSNGLTVFANTLTLGSLSTVANTALTSGVVDGIACAATPVAADGVYGIRDVATNASSAVCLWLPATAEGGQGLGTVGLVAASQPSTTGYELAYARDGGETETLVAPVVTSVEPSGTDVPVSGSVVLTFNTAMATSTGTVVLEGGGNTITLAGGSWDTTHTVYTAPFSGLKGLTDYTVEATFASAILGLAVSDTSHSFTTTTALYSASVTPTSKIFDPVVEGYESITPQQFVITNTGTNTLTDIQARLTGADDTSFEISSALAPTTIYPRASATISVHPKESLDARDTPYSATLSLANIAGLSLNIPLSLTVEEPSYVVALDIGSLDFGSLPPGYTHPAYRTLTITNTGNSTITGIGLSLSGSDTSAFAMELERGVSAVEPASSAELLLPASAAVLSPFAAPAAQLATWGDSPSTLTTLADGHTLEPGEQLKVDVAPVSGLAAREAPYTASLDVSSPETTTASSHLSFKVSAPGGGGDGKLPPTADTQAAAALLLGALLAAAGLAALALAFILPPVRYRPALPDNRKLKTAGR